MASHCCQGCPPSKPSSTAGLEWSYKHFPRTILKRKMGTRWVGPIPILMCDESLVYRYLLLKFPLELRRFIKGKIFSPGHVFLFHSDMYDVSY